MGDHLELFKFWIEQGWKYRLSYDEHMKTHVAKYKSRLKHEVDMIVEKNFVDYFLIVSDLIRWAKDHDIAVGPGRGSSAGSLVCYLLRITEINPMLYPMLFERFLDPTRNDEPDIDIDFESDRRDEVFVYATNKYGHEYVANILNFTRYLGRSSLDDIERVYHLPKWKIEAFKSKLLERPEGHPRFSNSIEDTINTFSEIRELVAEQPEIGYAIRLEGNIRNFNVHAAGMVVSAVPLAEICATYEREINGVVRQGIPYDKRGAAYVGLLKIDALSLITMGEIAAICKAANMNLLDLYRVPLDDEQTLKAFRDGDIMGIFQFEGITTRRILKAVQPTTFMHLADVNALARPGADDKQYIANKNSGDEIAYIHPIMREHLDWTYGTVVYEEQILMILRDLGGFAPAELNKMRKVIHDKLGSSQFNVYYERFVKGCAAHGLSEDTARKIWDGLVSASGYAFCVTGDTLVERGGIGGNDPKGSSPKITVAELYSRQQSKTPIGKKIRAGKLSLLSMDDDGRVRPNKLLKIQHPVKCQCFTITTQLGRSITVSKDHRLLTDSGYKLTTELKVGDRVVVELGWAARESERISNLTKVRTEPFKKHGVTMQGTDNPAWIDGRKGMLEQAFEEVWERDGAKCCHCGKEWDGTSHGLEFAHIMTLEIYEGDYSKYHDPKNIMLLCNSCHKTFDYRVQGSRNKRWGRGRPTGTDEIISLKDAGVQDVYDIFMEGPSHNYVGNEFINHNNIAHSVSYAHIGFWQQYLKIHFPAEFYTQKLTKCPSDDKGKVRRGKFIQEAGRHGIDVLPPNLLHSGYDWTLTEINGVPTILAGFEAIDGIGPKTTQNIIKFRNENPDIEWEDLIDVKGIGQKTIDKILEFVQDDDPFGVQKVAKTLKKVRQLDFLPRQTHISIDLPKEPERVCYIGILRRKKYYDAVEQLQKRTTGELSYDDALQQIKDPHLLKYATLEVEDEYGEVVKVSVNRWDYPKLAQRITKAKINRDVVVAQGLSSDFGGISIRTKNLTVINPEYQEGENEY